MGKHGAVPNILIGVSSTILLGLFMFGFGGADTIVDVAIHFGMQFLPADGQLKVWANVPHAAYVDVRLFGFTKVDLETNATTDVELMDFFPTQPEPNIGYAAASFGIELIDSASQPELNMTQEFVPMVWVRENTASARLQTLILIIAAFTLNNWVMVKWSLIAGMVLGLVAAIGMQVRGKGKDVDVEVIT